MPTNITKRIPIAIGIKPDQTATFTNKTIDCATGNGNTISNIPNSSLENSFIEINGTQIELGGTVTIVGGGGGGNFVSSLTAGTGISLVDGNGAAATEGDLTIAANLSLDELTDVNLGTPSNGHLLTYNGSEWASTALTETDPVFAASDVAGVVTQDITNWNEAYGWGDHSAASYLTSTGNLDTHTNVTLTSLANGDLLKYNGTNWVNSQPGTYLQGRQTASGASSTAIAPGDAANITISNVAKTYALLKIQTSAAAWVTLYTDTASRTADSSRLETQEPAPGSGVLAEIITTGPTTQILTPGVFGFNNDPTINSNVYAKVVSKEASGTTIHTVTLTYVQLEA